MAKHKSHHGQLIKNAVDAIDAVFGDKGVTPERTMADLRDLAEEIDLKINCLKNDLKKLGRL